MIYAANSTSCQAYALRRSQVKNAKPAGCRIQNKLMKFALALLLAVSTPASALEAEKVRWALGQIETGARSNKKSFSDQVRGRHHEVSRFQILPKLWKKYGKKADFTNPDTAWRVACLILDERQDEFRKATGQEWDAFWLYAMWNAPGKCRAADYQRSRLSPAVRERAQRFSNLITAYARN